MRNDLKRAVALVRKGYSYSEAADEIGLNRNQVAGACNRAGLKLGRKYSRSGGWRNRPKPRAELAAKLYREGKSYRQIAAELGLGPRSSPGPYLICAGVPLNRGRAS